MTTMQTDEVIDHQETQEVETEAVVEDTQAEATETVEEVSEESQEEIVPEKQVPLSALQKERKKRQDAEMRAEWQQQQMNNMQQQKTPEPEDDSSKYESVTREELSKSEAAIVRAVDERSWMKNNPEKNELLNEKLPEFLKQRPHLAAAIEAAPNRYEEAYTLMEALTPKQKIQLSKQPVKKRSNAPDSPAGVPKSSGINEAVDVMSMTDAEYHAYRKSKRKGR